MVIPRYFIVAERDHEIQNPTSEEKLRLLGERIRLVQGSRVLDIASGRGGPARVLAQAFGCRVEGVETAPEFHAAASPDDPDAGDIETRHKRHKRIYLGYGREYLGWAISIGWKPDGPS